MKNTESCYKKVFAESAEWNNASMGGKLFWKNGDGSSYMSKELKRSLTGTWTYLWCASHIRLVISPPVIESARKLYEKHENILIPESARHPAEAGSESVSNFRLLCPALSLRRSNFNWISKVGWMWSAWKIFSWLRKVFRSNWFGRIIFWHNN